MERFLDLPGSKILGSVLVSKDLILICQFDSRKIVIRNQSCEKYKIPSTILFKLVTDSSTENFVVIVVDRIDVAKPKGKYLNKIVRIQSTSTSSSWQEGPLAFHGPTPEVAETGLQLLPPGFWQGPPFEDSFLLHPISRRLDVVRLWSLRWPHWRREAALRLERAPSNMTG